MRSVPSGLRWLPPHPGDGWYEQVDRFSLDGVEVRCSFRRGSTPECLFIEKRRAHVEDYLAVLDRCQGGNIVELGIREGGSVALTALAGRPRKLVAVELEATRLRALDELLERRDLTGQVRPYYGVNQADRARLGAIADSEFGDEALDLVVDDASHLLAETRSSFETLFPRLRRGGIFLVEDWSWQHLFWTEFLASGRGREAVTPTKRPEQPLSLLTIELMLALAQSAEYVAEVSLTRWWIAIRRGRAELDPTRFRLADLFTDHWHMLRD